MVTLRRIRVRDVLQHHDFAIGLTREQTRARRHFHRVHHCSVLLILPTTSRVFAEILVILPLAHLDRARTVELHPAPVLGVILPMSVIRGVIQTPRVHSVAVHHTFGVLPFVSVAVDVLKHAQLFTLPVVTHEAFVTASKDTRKRWLKCQSYVSCEISRAIDVARGDFALHSRTIASRVSARASERVRAAFASMRRTWRHLRTRSHPRYISSEILAGCWTP